MKINLTETATPTSSGVLESQEIQEMIQFTSMHQATGIPKSK